MDFRSQELRIKPMISRPISEFELKLSAVEPLLKALNINLQIKNFGIKIFDLFLN